MVAAAFAAKVASDAAFVAGVVTGNVAAVAAGGAAVVAAGVAAGGAKVVAAVVAPDPTKIAALVAGTGTGVVAAVVVVTRPRAVTMPIPIARSLARSVARGRAARIARAAVQQLPPIACAVGFARDRRHVRREGRGLVVPGQPPAIDCLERHREVDKDRKSWSLHRPVERLMTKRCWTGGANVVGCEWCGARVRGAAGVVQRRLCVR